MSLKDAIRAITPAFAQRWYQTAKRIPAHQRNRRRSRAEVFTEIYDRQLWGRDGAAFDSGPGSDERFVEPYSRVVREIVASCGPGPVRLADLGCGDFRTGRRIIGPNVDYVGVDVVPPLIERNQREFGGPRVSFRCLDVVEEDPPDADVCTIRQVLQHLSNAEISRVVARLEKYPVVVVTEHYPEDDRSAVPNWDIPHGTDIRLYWNSAVYLDRPPFALGGLRLVLRVPHGGWGELRTFVIDRRGARAREG